MTLFVAVPDGPMRPPARAPDLRDHAETPKGARRRH